MKINKLLLALALIALTGCTIPKNPTKLTPIPKATAPKPPLPPLPSAFAKDRKIQFAPLSSTIKSFDTKDLKSSGDLEIAKAPKGTNFVLTWPTNMGYFVLYSTNLTTPKPLWKSLPKDAEYSTNFTTGRYESIVTNEYPACFFTLAQRPTNYVSLAWSYDFNRSPMATKFVLYSGTNSRSYSSRVVFEYRCLWAVSPTVVGTNYYTVTAMSDYGDESDYSNEVSYVRKDP